MIDLLRNGSASTPRLLFAHGAGAPMDSEFMNAIAERIAKAGFEVVRFEFEYMARQRKDGKRRGPDRAPKLIERFRRAMAQAGPPEELVIGGKSMGGRIATMIAEDAGVRAVLCLGYPFHPPGKPDKLRTRHLESIQTPTLIVQGTRDPFGRPDEVSSYRLSQSIEVEWIEGGDHSFKPRKRSGRTLEENLDQAAGASITLIRSCE